MKEKPSYYLTNALIIFFNLSFNDKIYKKYIKLRLFLYKIVPKNIYNINNSPIYELKVNLVMLFIQTCNLHPKL